MSRQPDSSFTLGSCATLEDGLSHVQAASDVDLEAEEAALVEQLEAASELSLGAYHC